MSDTLSTNAGLGYLYAASVADDTFISDFLIFTAVTFPVFGWSENSFAVKTVALRF